jgi:hypothetical protein
MNDDGQPVTEPQRFRQIFTRGLLIALFLVVVTRLLGFVVVINYTILQMDFAAFYAAGKTVSAGLNPYLNLVETDPELWDGVATFAHSRFLYPPLAARPFQLIALLPFSIAKSVWTISSLIALGAAMVLAFRLSKTKESIANLLVVGTIVGIAYPTMTLLERGQADAFTLLLILGALLMMGKGTRQALVGGGLLALATLMKLNCIFLIPFLLLRRRWHALLGFVAGGILLLGVSLVVDGPAAISDYAGNQMPRIAEHGEGGTPEMSLPRESFMAAMTGMSAGFSTMDGKPYRRQMFRFVINASAVQSGVGKMMRSAADAVGVRLSPSGAALILVAIFTGLLFFWQKRFGPLGGAGNSTGELAYWQLVLAILLLCGPVTWAMTTVWLLPLSVFLVVQAKDLHGKGETFALLLCAVGLGIVVAPDAYGSFMLSPFPREWMDLKYVVAELIVIVSLLWFWRQRSLRDSAKPADRPA